jgi:hypothetical protein
MRHVEHPQIAYRVVIELKHLARPLGYSSRRGNRFVLLGVSE